MGCKAFTPHLASLAKELEGQPFHLIASFNQNGTEEIALHELFQNGVPLTTTNVSATMQARHPGVRGTGYVPYYLVFDHHGDLVYHHQGGPYHGGDGKAVLDRVRKMLREVPRIYVGKALYTTHEKLAKSIASGKKLGRALKTLTQAIEETPDDPELKRLVAAVERHASEQQRHFERKLATQAKPALKGLMALAKEFRGTPWGGELVQRAEELAGKDRRKENESAAKKLAKILQAWDHLPTTRGNGGAVRNPVDPAFRSQNEAILKQIASRLESLAKEHGETPAGMRAKQLLAAVHRR